MEELSGSAHLRSSNISEHVRTLRAAGRGLCLSVGLMSLKEEDKNQLELVLILITAASERDTFECPKLKHFTWRKRTNKGTTSTQG